MDADLTEQAARLRERSCLGKNVYGAATARAVAGNARARGDCSVQPYRCLFDHPGAWHIGHAPSIEAVTQMAAVMRAGGHGPGCNP